MGEKTAIEWCDHTFNPWIGCTKVSPGCDHCYAEKLATARLGVAWGPHAERRRTAESTWRQPLAWNRKAEREGKRARVFCASLADVFDNQVPRQWRSDLWLLIRETPNLDWLLLTKRPQNITRFLPGPHDNRLPDWGLGWPNARLGVTAENQGELDRRAPLLLSVPAAGYFLSCEPLLGPLMLGAWVGSGAGWTGGIDWVIAGGESGPGARPAHPDWFRSLRDQCSAAGVPFFFKQWGEWRNSFGRPAETPGRFALAPRTWSGPIVETDRYPRQFTAFGSTILERVGKKAAGAILDGREHREVPA